MTRVLLLLLGILAMLPGSASWGQPPNPTPAPTAPATSSITPDQARAALEVLNDPKKRAAFTATLQVLAKAPHVPVTDTAPPPEATPLPLPLAPNSLGAQVLLTVSDFLGRAGDSTRDTLNTIQSVPLLWAWAYVMVTDPLGQAVLLDVAWRLLAALVAGLGVALAMRWLLRRPLRRLESASRALGPVRPAVSEADEAEDGQLRAEAGEIEARTGPGGRLRSKHWARRTGLTIARLLLVLLPLVGFLVVGHLFAASALGGKDDSRLIILAVFAAFALCDALIQVARLVLAPGAYDLRLIPLGDRPVAYVTHWFQGLVIVVVFGYAIAEVGRLLGMSILAHDVLLKAVGLLGAIGLAVMIVRLRRPVRRLIRAAPSATGVAAALRDRLAAVWHWIALFLVFAFWVVWAIDVRAGSNVVFHYFALTVLVLGGARLVQGGLLGLIDRIPEIDERTSERYPGIEGRLLLYHPMLTGLARGLVTVLALSVLLQVYGIGALTWLSTSAAGQRMISGVTTLIVTVAVAFAVWEVANAGIHRHLSRVEQGDKAARSARLRTLLPLLRTTLMITIIIVAGLMILSEIGVNIAPLLAGAGIVGVAIGFGSQKLVQDLITGVFLLLENAMQVGDTVTVSGLSGVVEGLSVRTIRLRAGDGSVHIIPFSAVTTVTNTNRGLGNAEVRITVDFDEDVDRVMQLLARIVTEMRGDPDFAPRILGDLQLWGVDKVDGAGVTIAGQVVCTDSGRWPVQREFNRRMKRCFQEEGIHLYNPLRTISVAGQPWGLPQTEAPPSQPEASHEPTG